MPALWNMTMDVRNVDAPGRTITGVVAPYDELTYLTPNPRGERITRGAFRRSIQNRGDKIPLCRGHGHEMVMGVSRTFLEDASGLIGEFVVNPGALGDAFLEDVRNGYLPYMSVGFIPTSGGVEKGEDGVAEIREAKLVEVSMVGIPAYEGAALLSVRNAETTSDLFAPFRDVPKWDLDPLPPFVYRPRR